MDHEVRLRRRGELSPTALGVVALVEGWSGAFLVVHVAAGVPSAVGGAMAGGAGLLFLSIARGVTAHGLAINLIDRAWWRLPAIALLQFVIAALQCTVLIEASGRQLGNATALAVGLAMSIWPLLLLRDCADLAHRPPPPPPVASALATLPPARLLSPTRRAARPTAPRRAGARPCAGAAAAPPRAASPAS